MLTKQVTDVYVTAETVQGETPILNLSVDTEQGLGITYPLSISDTLTFIGLGGIPITFVGTGPITFTVAGLVLAQQGVSVYGRYIGATGATTAPDMTLLELDLIFNDYSPSA
jgi:hypothetical protein